jgi:tetratricopeptide (TPR) repeat protein
MLFHSKADRRRLDAVEEKYAADETGLLLAAPEYLAIDPQHATALNALGKDALQAGRIDEAIGWLWKAVEANPLDAANYALLAQAYESDAASTGYAGHFWLVGLWLAASGESVRSRVSDAFERFLDEELDEADPDTYSEIAEARKEELTSVELPEELRERFRPYRFLQELARGCNQGFYDSLILDPVSEAPDIHVPVWRAALRSWARFEGDDNPEMISKLVALLGEFAGPEVLSDLWELTLLSDDVMFRHGHWAVWRMGKRFPAETISSMRARLADACVSLRCGMAEHLELMGRVSGVKSTLLDLMEDFPSIAGESDAPYLLLAVRHALTETDNTVAANELLARHKRSLSKEGRRWLDENFEDFVPRLVEEDLNTFAIDDVAFMGALMEGADGETEEDDQWDEDADFDDDELLEEDDDEPPVVKPGRNDPCWCGSGKKYKKCHLDADEEAERNPPEEDDDDFILNEAMDGLMSTADRLLTKREMERAGNMFFGVGTKPDEIPEEASTPFLMWYMLDYECKSIRRTPLQEHLRRYGSALDPEVLALLESWRDSEYGLFEVTAVEIGKCLKITNVHTAEEVEMPDTSASPTDIEGMLLGRLTTYQGERRLLPDILAVPRRSNAKLQATIEEESKAAGMSPAEYIRANAHRWYRLVIEA